jgi:hypothetical protein
VLFVRKVAANDASYAADDDNMFIGSGIIDKILLTDELLLLDSKQKKLHFENNWYGKIIFSKLVRFFPTVPLSITSLAGQNSLLLHGAAIPTEDILEIEKLAKSKVILA